VITATFFDTISKSIWVPNIKNTKNPPKSYFFEILPMIFLRELPDQAYGNFPQNRHFENKGVIGRT